MFFDPRPNEFACVPHDASTAIEIFVQPYRGNFVVIANKFNQQAGTAPEVYRSSEIMRGNSADGVARRLKKKRFTGARITTYY